MNFFDLIFPYCIKCVGERTLILLNRSYKPIGFDPRQSGYVHYESVPASYKLRRNWKKLAEALDYEIQPETPDLIFLYDANTAPFRGWDKHLVPANWSKYVRKLEILATLKPIQKD